MNKYQHLNDLEVLQLDQLIRESDNETLKAAISQTFNDKSLNQLVAFGDISESERDELFQMLDGECISTYLNSGTEYDYLKKVCILALDCSDFDYAAGLASDHELVGDISEVVEILIPYEINCILQELVFESGQCDLEQFFKSSGYAKEISTDLGAYYLTCKDGSL